MSLSELGNCMKFKGGRIALVTLGRFGWSHSLGIQKSTEAEERIELREIAAAWKCTHFFLTKLSKQNQQLYEDPNKTEEIKEFDKIIMT